MLYECHGGLQLCILVVQINELKFWNRSAIFWGEVHYGNSQTNGIFMASPEVESCCFLLLIDIERSHDVNYFH